MDIGIISEGVTDQIIIEAVLQGYLKDKDIILDPLQPKKNAAGGWPLVIRYCKSKDFQESLPYNDGITIIHIDCDVLKGLEIPADLKMELNGLSHNELFTTVKNKFIEIIGADIYEKCAHKLAFAIAVDMIECWFLPIYFPNKKITCNKTSNCIQTVNPELIRHHKFYINTKDPDKYGIISKAFRDHKTVVHCRKTNENFAAFINEFDIAYNYKQPEETELT